jgi:hypothetical protein
LAEALDAVRRELDFYLVELGEPDRWAYAVYHCGQGANPYSKVYWSRSDLDNQDVDTT